MFSNAEVNELCEKSQGVLIRTPCVYSARLSEITGAHVYLKLENMHRTGSFKERGALSFLLHAHEGSLNHVVTASAGNHAQAVALHAARLGIFATIFMPEGTPNTKVLATERLKARVKLIGSNYDEAFRSARDFAEEAHASYIHAYNNLHVIMGQATTAAEIFCDLPNVDVILVPVGGGGLIAGISQFVLNNSSTKRPHIIGVEAVSFPSVAMALNKTNNIIPNSAKTIAEGIAVRRAGELATEILAKSQPDMVVVNDEQIQAAIMFLLERQKIVAEGAGAAPVAAILLDELRHSFKAKTVVLVVSGGNIDISLLSRLTAQELVNSSRLCRMSLVIKDCPGSLSAFLQTVTKVSGNIIDIRHERSFADIKWNEVLIDVIIETKDELHENLLMSTLNSDGYVIKKHKQEH